MFLQGSAARSAGARILYPKFIGPCVGMLRRRSHSLPHQREFGKKSVFAPKISLPPREQSVLIKSLSRCALLKNMRQSGMIQGGERNSQRFGKAFKEIFKERLRI
jgi:hypothetical protein